MRGTKIEWQGGLLNSPDEQPVSLGKNKQSSSQSHDPQQISGKATLRCEKKGRAGNPVFILFRFSDPEAKNESSLKLLCSQLKNKLACGGTVENGEIILQCRDEKKLKTILAENFRIVLA